VFGARYVAKNIVAAGLAKKCSIQIAYAIGIARPISIYVNTFGTGIISNNKLNVLIKEYFDLSPRGMIEKLDLLRGDIYKKFPKSLFLDDYAWEKTDMVEALRQATAV
ncbi:MAG TPA: methionine adenosyltransferase, partial [Syntrophaceae bacterium]|nr:methionine adenosyltransferase [Syntrophaceae bacterium]